MNFNEHYDLKDDHAFLSPSQYAWLNYDEEKLVTRFFNAQKKEEGTRKHAFASEAIILGERLAKLKRTINLFVNDSIKLGLKSEVRLVYSEFCHGTADAIDFVNDKLYIFDLKTGETPGSFKQLYIYAALFCLEYNVDPFKIKFILRLYQYNTFEEDNGDAQVIREIMMQIIRFDARLTSIANESTVIRTQ